MREHIKFIRPPNRRQEKQRLDSVEVLAKKIGVGAEFCQGEEHQEQEEQEVNLFVPRNRQLPARTRWRIVLAGGVFLAGGVGVERATDWYQDHDQLNTLAYNLWNAVEEGLEMVGVVLFIRALLDYMGHGPRVEVHLESRRE